MSKKKLRPRLMRSPLLSLRMLFFAENQAKLDSYEKSLSKLCRSAGARSSLIASSTPTISSHSFTAVRRDRHFSML